MVTELHAGDGAAGLCAIEGGRSAEAVGGGERAPIGEAAALGGDNDGRGSHSSILLHEPVARHMGTRDRRNQQLRVRVLGSLHDPFDGACFDDVSAVEYEDRVAHLIGGGKIVGYVEDRDAALIGELAQRAEYCGPQRGVDHRDRLVGNDQLRLEQQRTRDHYALALAARQLVRETAEDLFRLQPDEAQGLADQLFCLRARGGKAEAAHRRRKHMIDPLALSADPGTASQSLG